MKQHLRKLYAITFRDNSLMFYRFTFVPVLKSSDEFYFSSSPSCPRCRFVCRRETARAIISSSRRPAVSGARTNIRQNRLVGLPAGQQSAIGAVRRRHDVLQTQVGHVVRQPGGPGAGHQQHNQSVRRRQTRVLGRPGAHMESVRGVSEKGRKGKENITDRMGKRYG